MWSDQEPIDKGRESIARIDRGYHHEGEIPANRYIPMQSTSGRYLWERSVSSPWRYINHGSTDRPKVLQISTLRAVRAMRAILCTILWRIRRIVFLCHVII
jgi:hypothetical protein